MDVDVEVARVLAHEPAVVAAFAGDPSHAPQWYANIREVRWLTDPPLAVGSRMAFVARFLGRTLAYTYEVLELQPGRRLVMATADGPFPMRTTYEWEPSGSGTLMRLRNTGRPHGFAVVAGPVMAAAMRRAMTQDLERLDAVLARLR